MANNKSDALENDVLLKLFNNTALDWDAATDLYVSLHSADLGEAGTQQTNEIAYTTYARVAVARSSGGWTVSTNTVTNAGAITFPICSAGSATAAYVGIGSAASGAGVLLYHGVLDASLAISAGITPSFAAGDLDLSEE
jgi:hypothetical protein